MQNRKLLALAIALLMFPQVAQTLYSPALADFANAFSVAPGLAAQALTVYFCAFAFGVVGWGWACDRVGRRPAMLCGLVLYAGASAAAMFVRTFDGLLISQACAALGAAVGSVVTQTVLRDRFSGTELARVFSIVGMVLAASPAVGLFAGAAIVHLFGYKGVMACLLALAVALLGWSTAALPETRPAVRTAAPLLDTLRTMSRDPAIWRSALLVAVFNVALFSYYALGPFVFQRLGLDDALYGYSGVVLAMGASLGAWLNKWLLKRGLNGGQLLAVASSLAMLGGIGVEALAQSLYFLLPMLLVVLAFGIAIPNVLGEALAAYRDRLGTAGALFGLIYYLMIGAGMMLVGATQALGGSLIVCGALAMSLCLAGASKRWVRR